MMAQSGAYICANWGFRIGGNRLQFEHYGLVQDESPNAIHGVSGTKGQCVKQWIALFCLIMGAVSSPTSLPAQMDEIRAL